MDGVTFGRGLKALRIRKRLRQDDLADASDVSRGVIARIEASGAANVTVATLEQVAAPLGARVVCRLSWNGEGLDRLLDADHAGIVEQIVRLLSTAGWLVATEVSFNHFGERGSIDILAFHQAVQVVLVIEVKSAVPDVQATLVALDRKVRLAPGIARERGWAPSSVAKVLVVREDRTARRRIETHAATFAAAFPDRARACRRWIDAPVGGQPLRGLWFLSNESQAVAKQRVRRPRPPSERGPGTAT